MRKKRIISTLLALFIIFGGSFFTVRINEYRTFTPEKWLEEPEKRHAIVENMIKKAVTGVCLLTGTAESKSKNASFEIYLVKDMEDDAVQKAGLNKLPLEENPLVSHKDIIAYNWQNHSFKIKNNGIAVYNDGMQGNIHIQESWLPWENLLWMP